MNISSLYIIERDFPNAGNLSSEELKNISEHSCCILNAMSDDIEWIESYITQDKIYCKYKASNPELLIEHAKKAGFPISKISGCKNIIGPNPKN